MKELRPAALALKVKFEEIELKRKPTVWVAQFIDDGGLMSYAADYANLYRSAAEQP